GLTAETISLGARILAVADVYDALVSDRPYRSGMDQERVMEIIKKESGKQFDPNVVQALLEVMRQENDER
ncbi:MAG: transcriptional regulator, partial [Desulfobacteraceae bacterium]